METINMKIQKEKNNLKCEHNETFSSSKITMSRFFTKVFETV